MIGLGDVTFATGVLDYDYARYATDNIPPCNDNLCYSSYAGRQAICA